MMIYLRRFFYTLVGLYTLVGFFLVPYLVKTKGVELVNEQINGTVSIESVNFNPYSFIVQLGRVELKSLDNKSVVSFEKLNLNLQVLSLLNNTVHVTTVELVKPYVNVVYSKDKKINLLSIVKPSSTPDENKTASKPPRFILDALLVREGVIKYDDYTKPTPYTAALNSLELSIKNIDTDKNSTKSATSILQFDLDGGGSVEIKNSMKSISPFIVDGTLDLKSIALYSQYKYIKDMLNLELADGKLDAHAQYHIDLDDLKNINVEKTSLAISNLRIKPKNKPLDILNIAIIRLDNINAKPMIQEASVGSFGISGVDLKVGRVAQNRVDWQDYIKINSANEKVKSADKNESKAWKFALKEFDLKNLAITMNDMTIVPSLVTKLENTSLHVSDLSLNKNSLMHYNFSTLINHETAVGANGALSLKPLKQEGELSITNLGFNLLNPYIGKLTAPITADGALNLHVKETFSKEDQVKFLVKSFDLNSSAIGLKDDSIKPAQKIELTNLALHVSDLASNPKSWFNYKLKTNVNGNALLDTNGKLLRQPLKQEGNVLIDNFDLSFLNPYIKPYTYLNIKNGMLSLSGKESFDSTATKSPKLIMNGKFGLNKVVLKDERKKEVLASLSKLDFGYTFDYAPNRLYIDKVLIDSLYSNVIIDQNKTLNFAKLMKQNSAKTTTKTTIKTTKQEAKKSDPFALKVAAVILKNSSTDFADQSLLYRFKTHIHDLNGKIYSISSQMDETSTVDLDGIVDQYGSAKIKGSLNAANPKKYTDINLKFSNLALNNLTAYSATFAGYKINSGKLFLKLGYKIDDSKLDATNNVVIKQIKLGDTVKDSKVTVWPLRFAVALLEDSDGVIDIDLPIKGDLDNPDFKYGAVVWKVLGNIVTKAVTAPFKLLGSMLGFDGEALQSIDFEAGKTLLLPPEVEKLDNLTKAMQKRMKLVLNVGATYDVETDKKALQRQKLIELIVKKSGATNEIERRNAINAEMLEGIFLKNSSSENLDKIKEDFRAEYKDIKKFNEKYTMKLAQEDSKFMPVSQEELTNLAVQRAKAISEYLVKKQQLDVSRVVLNPISAIDKSSKEVKTKLDINVK
jgi:hypothetical protein